MSFSDMPTDVGPIYEGERIRSKQMYVELITFTSLIIWLIIFI
jgi:CO dehydrogenase/acetyl-CoA synthase beta subunit